MPGFSITRHRRPDGARRDPGGCPAAGLPVLLLFLAVMLPVAAWGADVPAALVRWGEGENACAVLVDKSAQRIFLYRRGHESKPVRTYPCSTGENPGPKTRKNDKKTPEGVYFFVDSFVAGQLTPIYGCRAFPLDYPNPMDREEGRGGYGIWLHGTNEPLRPMNTNGCVVMENRDILDLANHIRLFETPVIIMRESKRVPAEVRRREAAVLGERVNAWLRFQRDGDRAACPRLYSPRCRPGGMDRDCRIRHAPAHRNSRPDIPPAVDHLQLLENSGRVLARFYLVCGTPPERQWVRTRLYFEKSGGRWEIIGEFTERPGHTRRGR